MQRYSKQQQTISNSFVEDRKLCTPVLNTSTRTQQVIDFVVDVFESKKTKTMKYSRDFPYIPKHPQSSNNYRYRFVIQMRAQTFITCQRYIFRCLNHSLRFFLFKHLKSFVCKPTADNSQKFFLMAGMLTLILNLCS